VLAALFGYVRNQGDGWNWTLNHLDRHATVLIEQTLGEEEPHALYVAQIETLGRRVGELHAALACASTDDAFAPEAIGTADIRRWTSDVRREATQTLHQLREAMPQLPESIRAQAKTLLGQRAKLLKKVQQLEHGKHAIRAAKTRYHGDLHLGQVLLVRDDFLIIDFEGEPGRTFAQRRAKHSALRDVAGMLRSFDYARAVARERAGERKPEAVERIDASLGEWLELVREAFLRGYSIGVGKASCMPRSEPDASRLIAFFEIEKALYELRYEIEHRPTWVGVPIEGVLGILNRH